MKREIIINVHSLETRAAILEDDLLVGLLVERLSSRKVVGNIYKGKVVNVLPGMEAAFVDIGLEKNAFLYVDDAIAANNVHGGHDDDIEDIEVVSIKDIVTEGQDILVQVTKEPIGSKGARVVSAITLPGRYLVLMPTVTYVGISRRIDEEKERERLKSVATSIRPKDMGLIVRTAAEDESEKEITQDVHFLTKVWRKLNKKAKKSRSPALLYEDYDLVYRVVRDLFTEEVDRLVIDSKEKYDDILDLLDVLSPKLKSRIQLYRKDVNIFDYYGLENEVKKSLKTRVWLDCGGYLIIDEAEALTSIDVNTGKFIGSVNLADTVLRTNIQAAVEIARQIRLRNMGGIIIIDFIDMDTVEDRQKVVEVFEREMKRDKTRMNIVSFTELGLLQVTRKKVREGLSEALERECPYCDGSGRVLSEETMAIEVERKISQIAKQSKAEAILIVVNPSVAAMVIGTGGANLSRIERELNMSIYVKGSKEVHMEEIKVSSVGDRAQIKAEALPVSEGEIIEVEIEESHVSNEVNGIARVEGYVIDVEKAAGLVGKKAKVEINKAFRTYAKGSIVP